MKAKKKFSLKPVHIAAPVLVAVALLPLFDGSGGMQLAMHLAIVVCVYMFLGQSWNILAGLCGMFSVGHAAFYGVGAYCVAIGMTKLGTGLLPSVLLGMAIAVLLALLLGAISSKLSGFYFTMSTMALGEVMRTISINWFNVTGSQQGLSIARPIIPRWTFLYLALLLAVAAVFIFALLRRSKLGSMFVAIRENRNLASSLGGNVALYKTIAAVISAMMASLGGAFMTYYTKVVDPSVFANSVSTKMLVIVIIGGIGTQWGPIIGALSILLEEAVKGVLGANFAPVSVIIYGAILVLIILFRPEGISSLWRDKQEQKADKPAVPPTEQGVT